MHLWGTLQERTFSPNAHVTADLPCQGCGYNLREAKLSGVCPECGRHVRDSLVPLDEPEKVATGLRYIGNSYLGLLALPLVPFAAGMAASCAGWTGVVVLVTTSVARACGVADLRFRSSTGQLPVVGSRLGVLWLAAVADVALVAGCLLLLVAGAAGGDGAGWINGVAMGVLGLWMVAAAVVAAIAGWMGAALAAMLGYETLSRRLRMQWMLMAAGPAVMLALILVSLALGAIGGPPAAAAMGIFTVLALAVLWLIGVAMTLTGMSELAKVVERKRDICEEKLGTATDFLTAGPPKPPAPS
jgi:hypothetical protein